MTTATALEVHQKIEQYSETNATAKLRQVPKMKIGQAVRQGDIYVSLIESVPADYAKHETNGSMQLVPGTTQGSRHVIDSVPASMKIYMPQNKSELFGPIIEAKKEFTISHPEHAHVCLQPGLYQVTFQENWAEKERRVRD